MSVDMGGRIRKLRLSCSMTQEQLAKRLGVSAQAVSKWESGTNMPDIQMLPDLSIIFGVTIDDLFAMTDEHRMERIENMLYDVRFLPYDEFLQHEKYLKELQSKPEYSAEAGLLAYYFNAVGLCNRLVGKIESVAGSAKIGFDSGADDISVTS